MRRGGVFLRRGLLHLRRLPLLLLVERDVRLALCLAAVDDGRCGAHLLLRAAQLGTHHRRTVRPRAERPGLDGGELGHVRSIPGHVRHTRTRDTYTNTDLPRPR